MTELLSIQDVARRIGVAAHRVCYAHVQGKLAEPRFWVAGKRVYTAADLRKVAAYFARKRGRRTKTKGDDASAGTGTGT
jgi:DNA-binding transcriptional MerR regulator